MALSSTPDARRLSYEEVLTALNAALALGLAWHLLRQLISPREMAATDFTVFRTGWSLVLQGRVGELYDAAAQAEVQRGLLAQVGSGGFQEGTMAFLHPPHAALAGCALGWLAQRLGTPVAFWTWTACSLVLLADLARRVKDELGLGGRATATVAVTLAAFYPILETLQQGQVSSLLAVAALAVPLAVRRRRALAAAAWLLVLSIKPQTLPVVLVVLAVRREWRVLAWAAALGGAAALGTALALGPHVWWDYLAALHGLERYFGVGTPDHMPTVRGFLTRLLDGSTRSREATDAVTAAAWLAAIVAAGIVAARTRLRLDERAPLAFAMSIGWLASPHLFPQDVLLWVAPVTLVLSSSRDASETVQRLRTRIVLAWPLWFALARVLDIRDTPRPQMPVDLMLVPLVLAAAWAAREVARAPAHSGPGRADAG